MRTLVVGATGATGRLLVRELLARGVHVRAIVRSSDRLPRDLVEHASLTVIEAGLLDLSDRELTDHVAGCDAVASCLGHSLSFHGIFGPPHRLVTQVTTRLCEAIRAQSRDSPTKYLLMSSAGVVDPSTDAMVSSLQRFLLLLLRALVPPHADNEQAAERLRVGVGHQDRSIEWAVIRPDTLTNEETTTAYAVHPSPTRSAIFDPGKTSRNNVAHFMARLICDESLWREWRSRMPVIYNAQD